MSDKSQSTGLRDLVQALLKEQGDLRGFLEGVCQAVLEAEMVEHLKAEPYERTEERRGYRSGHRVRPLQTRVGTLTLAVPQSRDGQFSTELFERYQRSEKAFVGGLMEMVVMGVSTRKVRKVTEKLCGVSFSKSTVSELVKSIDEQVKLFLERPLDEHAYPYLLVDARYEKVRENGRVVSRAVLVGMGVRSDGKRSIVAVQVADSENEDDWLEFFRVLKRRGLSGLKLVVSDDHRGLVCALERAFQGVSWQRCYTHFKRNASKKAPSRDVWRQTMQELDRILAEEPCAGDGEHQLGQLVIELVEKDEKNTGFAEWLDDNFRYCLPVLDAPEGHRRRIRSTNCLERLNREFKRRSRVVGIFPNRASLLRLMGALAQEFDEEWITAWAYVNPEAFEGHNWTRTRSLTADPNTRVF